MNGITPIISFLLSISSLGSVCGIRVLNSPKYLNGKPPDAAATIANPKNVSTSELTICVWVLNFYKEISVFVEDSENRAFALNVEEVSNYVKINSIYYRYSFPPTFEWLPETWALFCFAFDNRAKIFKIYLNAEEIFQDQQKIKLKDYKIAPDFLKYQQIGQSKRIAGRITQLNMWSSILTLQEVLEVYKCRKVDHTPDILDWETVQFNLGPNITIENLDDKEGPFVEGYVGKEETYMFKDIWWQDARTKK